MGSFQSQVVLWDKDLLLALSEMLVLSKALKVSVQEKVLFAVISDRL